MQNFLSEASFQVPEFISVSAWLEHAPFAFWLLDVHRPRILVELGTHTGFSYLVFNQALKHLGTKSRCFAVDTWKGDEHAGFYDEEIFTELQEYNARHYGDFSELVRAPFDEAVASFEAGTIDLLHIDGRHFYEDVKHDFETWKPKLSDRGIVLLHDTNVRVRDFGVYRLWDELKTQYPHFEFLQGHGLGVLGVGGVLPEQVKELFAAATDQGIAQYIRQAYARLGGALEDLAVVKRLDSRGTTLGFPELDRARADIGRLEADVTRLEADISQLERKTQTVESENTRLHHDYRTLEHERDELSKEAQRSHDQLQKGQEEILAGMAEREELQTRLSQIAADRDRLKSEFIVQSAKFSGVMGSRSWRITKPLRASAHVARALKVRLQAVRMPWRTLMLQLRRHKRLRAESQVGLESNAGLKSDKTRVVFISGEEDTPGHKYRIAAIASSLAPCFFETAIINSSELAHRLNEIAGANVVWIWRAPWSENIAAVIDSARRNGAKIVFDVDDLMFRPELAVTELIDGIRSLGLTENAVSRFYSTIQATMAHSDHCTVPTISLAREVKDLWKPVSVIPNGFDRNTFERARAAWRARRSEPGDGLVRIGYATGSRTHQRDLAIAVPALVAVLSENPLTRLVLFRRAVILEELTELQRFERQIEWRELVPVDRLPLEYARFDINLAPLEVGNRFCEAKSELKFFEAALVGVPTIASPTAPFANAIRDGETGFLAKNDRDWYECLTRLVKDRDLRDRIADRAYREVQWFYGPERRNLLVTRLVNRLLAPAPVSSELFRIDIQEDGMARAPEISIADYDVLYQTPKKDTSRVSVIIPVFNYGHYLEGALESVRRQTIHDIDVIVVDDQSTDNSADVAKGWLTRYASDFNMVALLQNRRNAKLAASRNVGVSFCDTEIFFPLDPDNFFLPDCIEKCLARLDETGAAYVYPTIEVFGDRVEEIGILSYEPAYFRSGNYIDAMAMVRKAAWIAVGGYSPLDMGYEDYEFWCKLAEKGMFGARLPETVARYRAHSSSMLATVTDIPENKKKILRDIVSRHPWLQLESAYASKPNSVGLARQLNLSAQVNPVDKADEQASGTHSAQQPMSDSSAEITAGGERVTPDCPDDNFISHLSIYDFSAQAVRGRSVLDAGCGTGYGCYHLLTKGAAASVTGVDISPITIEYCKRRYRDPALKFVQGELGKPGAVEGTFGYIFCSNVLEHVSDIDATLLQISRALENDGSVLIAVPCIVCEAHLGSNFKNPYHINNFHPVQWLAKIRRFFENAQAYGHGVKPNIHLSEGGGKVSSLSPGDFLIRHLPSEELEHGLDSELNLVVIAENARKEPLPVTDVEWTFPMPWDIRGLWESAEPARRYVFAVTCREPEYDDAYLRNRIYPICASR